MSYIINNTNPFVSIKLTEKGREKLAKGQLNFSFWGIGDSEINYDREEVVDNNPSDYALSGVSRILRPVDRQPNIKSFITTGGADLLNTLSPADIKVIKAIVNNEATDRGFFSGVTYETLTASTYIKGTEFISNSQISGGTSLYVSTGLTSVGDFLLIKLSNDTVGTQVPNGNVVPIPHLWYKVHGVEGNKVILDRKLPNYSAHTATTSQIIIYKSGEVHESFGTGNTSAYWNTGTLEFDSCCDVSCSEVPVWNMNNVYCENLAGMSGGTHEDYTRFGSYQYLGEKHPYFEYICYATDTSSVNCDGDGSVLDGPSKSVSIIHYTNNTISNYYGEFFHIDNSNGKTVKLVIPDIMYHRRNFATGSGTTMGMTFLASGATTYVGDSDIEYIDLIEDATLVDGEVKVVGRVYPQLKMIVIHDDEVVGAMSYKSNRNWTLPPLSATLTAPSGNTSTGILEVNQTMYLTYILENDTQGLATALPCQKYIKITNSTSSAKDVSFKISDVDLLPFMRKKESLSYDGLGFYAHKFKVLYQIVADDNDRPDSSAWKVYDYTSTGLTTNTGETINPVALENQIPSTHGFMVNKIIDSGTTIFNLVDILSLPAVAVSPISLNFGDERFFYGNVETYIGATIFKTLFDIRVNSSQFTTTNNTTRSSDASTNPPLIKISEVGIYDSNKELVVIGKLSSPVKLVSGNTIMLELSMDF